MEKSSHLSPVLTAENFEAPKTFLIQRWDNKVVSIQARSYYKTENTYVFTNLAYSELKNRWHRGTLMEVPPVLEVDVDAVVMIADGSVMDPPVRSPRKRKTAALQTKQRSRSKSQE